jgi:hypothetical protein
VGCNGKHLANNDQTLVQARKSLIQGDELIAFHLDNEVVYMAINNGTRDWEHKRM